MLCNEPFLYTYQSRSAPMESSLEFLFDGRFFRLTKSVYSLYIKVAHVGFLMVDLSLFYVLNKQFTCIIRSLY